MATPDVEPFGVPVAPAVGEAVLISDAEIEPDGLIFEITVDAIIDPFQDYEAGEDEFFEPRPEGWRWVGVRYTIRNLLASEQTIWPDDLWMLQPDGSLAMSTMYRSSRTSTYPPWDRLALAGDETATGWRHYALPADATIASVTYYGYRVLTTLVALSPMVIPPFGQIVDIRNSDGATVFKTRLVGYIDGFSAYVAEPEPIGPGNDERVIALTVEMENLAGDPGEGILLTFFSLHLADDRIVGATYLKPAPDSGLVQFDPSRFRDEPVITGSILFMIPGDARVTEILFIDIGISGISGPALVNLGAVPTERPHAARQTRSSHLPFFWPTSIR